MTHVLHRSIAHKYPVAASASGITIRDQNGKEYMDFSGGAAVSCVGHSHPDVLAAMRSGKQLKVSFQNLGKENITIPMPLADFATAYEKIK